MSYLRVFLMGIGAGGVVFLLIDVGMEFLLRRTRRRRRLFLKLPQLEEVHASRDVEDRKASSTFRVQGFTSPAWEAVELIVPMGSLLKVRQARPGGKFGIVTLAQIHPEDRARVEELVRGHPGTSEVLEFDPE